MIQTASHLSPDAFENIQTESLKSGLEFSSIFTPVRDLVRFLPKLSPTHVKGCRGQGGASQAGAKQADGARNVSSQAIGSRNASSQATGSSKHSVAPSTSTGARNALSQAIGSSQPSATPSTSSLGPSQHSAGPTQACQGPRQGFQAPRPTPSFGPQRLTKKIASR
ncbi:hypothetical protein Tco_1387230, partial [Tanacetum coccineum]